MDLNNNVTTGAKTKPAVIADAVPQRGVDVDVDIFLDIRDSFASRPMTVTVTKLLSYYQLIMAGNFAAVPVNKRETSRYFVIQEAYGRRFLVRTVLGGRH